MVPISYRPICLSGQHIIAAYLFLNVLFLVNCKVIMNTCCQYEVKEDDCTDKQIKPKEMLLLLLFVPRFLVH